MTCLTLQSYRSVQGCYNYLTFPFEKKSTKFLTFEGLQINQVHLANPRSLTQGMSNLAKSYLRLVTSKTNKGVLRQGREARNNSMVAEFLKGTVNIVCEPILRAHDPQILIITTWLVLLQSASSIKLHSSKSLMALLVVEIELKRRIYHLDVQFYC